MQNKKITNVNIHVLSWNIYKRKQKAATLKDFHVGSTEGTPAFMKNVVGPEYPRDHP